MKEQTLHSRIAWSLSEVAAMTGLSLPFIRLQVKLGNLATTRIGRRIIVTRTAIDEFVKEKGIREPK